MSPERLLLPPLTREHTAYLAVVHSDPEVARFVGADRLTDEMIGLQATDFADKWTSRGYGQSATILRETQAFVGRIGLHFWPHWDEIELGYILTQTVQGSGRATEGQRAWLAWADAASIGLAVKPSTRVAFICLRPVNGDSTMAVDGLRDIHVINCLTENAQA